MRSHSRSNPVDPAVPGVRPVPALAILNFPTPVRDRIIAASRRDRAPTVPDDQQEIPALRPLTPDQPEDRHLLMCAAAEIYRMRRRRERHLPAGLVGEPAWDILLTLYAEQDREIGVSSACLAASVPVTTGLRWLDTLVSGGQVTRRPAANDRRRTIVELTLTGRSMIENCLRSMLRD